MPLQAEVVIAKCRTSSAAQDPNYRQAVHCGRHELVCDEHQEQGGQDAGPTPFEYLLGGLAACTAITLRMYAQRKGWELGAVDVSLVLRKGRDTRHIERRVTISAPLSEEQRNRLAEICEKTPVTLAVRDGTAINTTLEASAP
jgi:putative redox protein